MPWGSTADNFCPSQICLTWTEISTHGAYGVMHLVEDCASSILQASLLTRIKTSKLELGGTTRYQQRYRVWERERESHDRYEGNSGHVYRFPKTTEGQIYIQNAQYSPAERTKNESGRSRCQRCTVFLMLFIFQMGSRHDRNVQVTAVTYFSMG